jgi:hypothetical protein
MRISLTILALLLGLAGGAPCQTSLAAADSPTVPQLKEMLDASQRRGQLEMEGGAPFHLVASFEAFDIDGKSDRKGKLDELWESPRQYRQSITTAEIRDAKSDDGKTTFRQDFSLLPRTLVEIDNETQGWRTGRWIFTNQAASVLLAALQPLRLRSSIGNRLSYVTPARGIQGVDCVGTEPDLPGIGDDVKLALTTFCLGQGNHLLRLIAMPNKESLTFSDVEPFGKKYVARTVEYWTGARLRLKVHVDLLEAADDFTSLYIPVPETAQKLWFHRADQSPLTGEVMRGQVLTMASPLAPHGGLRGNITVKVHIDTTGNVVSAEVVSADTQILKAPFLTAAKQFKFRVSYQGTQLVPVDLYIFFHDGTPEDL